MEKITAGDFRVASRVFGHKYTEWVDDRWRDFHGYMFYRANVTHREFDFETGRLIGECDPKEYIQYGD